MASLHITLFGRFCCSTDGHAVGGIEARKVQELLTYLLLHRAQPATRDSLATLLWGERNDVQARKYLRQALWQLQSALEAACPSATHLLRTDADWIEINPAVSIWLDVEEFEHVYTTTRRLDDSELSVAHVNSLCAAVRLYRGDLLDGWYQDWCVSARERLQQMYLAMLDKLIVHAEHIGDYVSGIHYCELALRCDPARERTHRRLMRLHCMAGNRTAALRQYESCVAMLRRELSVEPAKSTLLLYEQIRSDQFGVQSKDNSSSLQVAQPTVDLGEMTDILAHLDQIQATLVQSLHQVQRDIARVEILVQRYATEATSDRRMGSARRPTPHLPVSPSPYLPRIG